MRRVDTAGRIWECDSVQLAAKEVRLTLLLWMLGAGDSPGQPSFPLEIMGDYFLAREEP